MKTTFWSLVVITPDSPGLQKIRISSTAILIIAGAFVVAFCTTVALLLMFPHARVNDTNRTRLAAENQVLRIENKDLVLGVRKLDSQVSHLDVRSQQVAASMQTD
jgi:hypothetical protein